jgi:hypothetical protein
MPKPTPMQVEEIEKSDFGGALFNLYTRSEYSKGQLFSGRCQVVRCMIQAMLIATMPEDGAIH